MLSCIFEMLKRKNMFNCDVIYLHMASSNWNTSATMLQTHWIQSTDAFMASKTHVTTAAVVDLSLQISTSAMMSVSHWPQVKANDPATMARKARAKRSLAILKMVVVVVVVTGQKKT